MESHADTFLEECSKHVDMAFQQEVVVPGQETSSKISLQESTTKLGHGLQQVGEHEVLATVAGTMSHRAPSTYWVSCSPKWYSPKTGDQVVGIIEDKTGEHYKVNIQSGSTAFLSRVGFEGATKRNKPELKTGEVVYCRVQLAHKGIDTELTCIASGGVSKKEWSSGESVYGALNGGQLLKLSIGFSRELLLPNNFLLATLAKKFPFEVAIGVNGFVWFRTGCFKDSVVAWNTLTESDRRKFDEYQIDAFVDVLSKRVKEAHQDQDKEGNH